MDVELTDAEEAEMAVRLMLTGEMMQWAEDEGLIEQTDKKVMIEGELCATFGVGFWMIENAMDWVEHLFMAEPIKH